MARLEIKGMPYDGIAGDFTEIKEVGRGAYGAVYKMEHKPSGLELAVKKLPYKAEKEDDKGLNISMAVHSCPYAVRCYGSFVAQGEVWMVMELMDISLDKLYQNVYKNDGIIPEEVLGKIAVAMVKGLHFLKKELKIIHRDVKPSNILINKNGEIKICDFGISGTLVDSVAKTQDKGCKPYMAPERIDPILSSNPYDIKSDVWSLGMTMYELATGEHPYDQCGDNVFLMLTAIVDNDPPRLSTDKYSQLVSDFIALCLAKKAQDRPDYDQLLADPFIRTYENENCDKVMADFLTKYSS